MRAQLSRMSVVLSAAIVGGVGLLTLLGLLLGDFPYNIPDVVPTLGGTSGTIPAGTFATFFVQIATVTLALAFIIGVLNLLYVNGLRALGTLTRRSSISAGINSVVVLVSFVAAFVLYFTDRETSMVILEEVQVPLESALASLLFFALVYGAARTLKNRVTLPRMVFVVTLTIVLLGALNLPDSELLQSAIDWMFDVPVTAGARGILLGVALATIVVGLRILIGQDRSYGE